MLSRTFSPHILGAVPSPRPSPRPSLRYDRGYRSLTLTCRAFSPCSRCTKPRLSHQHHNMSGFQPLWKVWQTKAAAEEKPQRPQIVDYNLALTDEELIMRDYCWSLSHHTGIVHTSGSAFQALALMLAPGTCAPIAWRFTEL